MAGRHRQALEIEQAFDGLAGMELPLGEQKRRIISGNVTRRVICDAGKFEGRVKLCVSWIYDVSHWLLRLLC
jgi:hypothetical protein